MAAIASPSNNRLAESFLPGQMSEDEFVQWLTDDIWAEGVDGEVVMMNAVSLSHNDMYLFVLELVIGFVKKFELGKVLSEPFQVRLPRQRRRRSPDIAFVSNEQLGQLRENQFNGGPDLVIEIVSRESQERDRQEKFAEYEAAGVKEYWLVDPTLRSFEAYSLNEKRKYILLPVIGGAVHSKVLAGVYFRPEWVYQLKLPDVPTLLRQFSRNRKKLASSRRA